MYQYDFLLTNCGLLFTNIISSDISSAYNYRGAIEWGQVLLIESIRGWTRKSSINKLLVSLIGYEVIKVLTYQPILLE